jgi:hypothetical protein
VWSRPVEQPRERRRSEHATLPGRGTGQVVLDRAELLDRAPSRALGGASIADPVRDRDPDGPNGRAAPPGPVGQWPERVGEHHGGLYGRRWLRCRPTEEGVVGGADGDLRGARFERADLSGATFERVDLSGARFERADLSGARLRLVDLRGVRVQQAVLQGAVLRGVELVDVDIDGEVAGLTINGVDVAPLIEAELDRRHPEWAKLRPTDPAGFREAWTLLEQLWDDTVERARELDPELLHESVDGEWSFIQTLRHLVFATDAWIRRALLGDPSPWDRSTCPTTRSGSCLACRATATPDRRWTRCWRCDVTGWRPSGRCSTP